MIAIFNLFLILCVGGGTYIAFKAVDGWRNKALSIAGGVVALAVLATVLPSAVPVNTASPSAQTSRSTYSPASKPETVDVTLRSYKEKGDSVRLQCSGTTGNITCKPRD